MSKSRLVKEKEVGKIYGVYQVLDLYKKDGRSFYKVVCRNGHERDVRSDALKRQTEICYACDIANPLYKSNTYNSWDAMVQRTTNPANCCYYKYGAVGIGCFPEWSEPGGVGFKNFYSYMGDCPDGMSLDRWPNNQGNYEPGNVRWATDSEQGYNQKRRSTNTSGRTGVYEYKGKWEAYITVNNKHIRLGRFSDFEDAVKVREEAEIKYFGENKE